MSIKDRIASPALLCWVIFKSPNNTLKKLIRGYLVEDLAGTLLFAGIEVAVCSKSLRRLNNLILPVPSQYLPTD